MKNYLRKVPGKLLFMLLVMYMVLPGGLSAQVASYYVFSQANETYTPIIGGTVLVTATDHSTFTDQSMDQGNYSFVIPFQFNFNGVNYTSGNVNTNGYITFGSTLPLTSLSAPISSSTAFNGVVSAMARDLWGVYGSVGTRTTGSPVITAVTDFTGIATGKPIRGTGIATGTTITAFDQGQGTITMSTNATANSASTFIGWPIGQIRTETIGTAPYRTFVIQYSGMSDVNTSAPAGNTMDFQIQLLEGGSVSGQQIKIVYGPMTNLSTLSRTQQVGLRGAGSFDYNNRNSSTSWTTTAAGTSNFQTITRTNLIYPQSGLAFIWSPPPMCSGTPTPGTASVNYANLCYSRNAVLTLTGYPLPHTAVGYSFQWQSSLSPGGPFTNVTGGSGDKTTQYVTGPLQATTYFNCQVTCNGSGLSASSNTITVNVNSPQVVSVTPGSRCGTGTVNLSATGDPGKTIAWYSAPTGGTPLATGNTFTTPVISSSTTYYVASSDGPPTATLGLSPSVSNCGTLTATPSTDYPIRFNTLAPVTIHKVTVIPNAAGAFTYALRNSLSTTNIQTATFSFTASQVGQPQTVLLGFAIPNAGNYQLVNTAGGGYRIGPMSCSPYPFTSSSGNFSIVGSASSSTGPTNLTTYNMFYNIVVSDGCEGTRVPVDATVIAPPAITTVSSSNTICNGGSANLSVSSSNTGYSYSWIPGNQSGASVSVSPVVNTTYIITAEDSSGCVNVDSVRVNVLPASAVINSSGGGSNVCFSGSKVLTVSPSTGYDPNLIQWQDSPDGITWTNIIGTTGTTYTTPVVGSTTHYRAQFMDSNGNACLQPAITLNVGSPAITGTIPGSRCGVGTVNLSATGNSGTTLNWYDSPTGGVALGTGNSFTTPMINDATTYYVAASGQPVSTTLGISPTNNTCGAISSTASLDQPLRFSTLAPVTINTVTVIPSAAGSYLIALRQSLSSSNLQSVTYNFTAAQVGIPQVVALNFSVPVPGNYQLTIPTRGGYKIGILNCAYPFTSPGGNFSIVGSAASSTSPTITTSYNIFFDINISEACESARTAVVADITPSPAIVASTSNSIVCEVGSATIEVSSQNGNYNYSWTSNPAGFTATGPGPHTVIATDRLKTYEVYGFDPATQCGARSSVTVSTVSNNIVVNTISTPTNVCIGADAQLNVTAEFQTYIMGADPGPGFIDISASGNQISGLQDNSEHNITIPGSGFMFNGVNYTNARVGTNGIIALGSSSGILSMNNAMLPSTINSAGNVLLAPYWDDLLPPAGGTIQTQFVGSTFIIQYTNMPHVFSTNGSTTFQVQLDLVTGVVRYLYRDVIFGNSSYDAGFAATIGIQYSASKADLYSHNKVSLVNGQSISFTPATPNFSYDWTPNSNYLNNSTIFNPVAQAVQSSETYVVVVTDMNTGCIKNDTITVDALPLPIPSAFSNSPVCENQNVQLFAFDGINYNWTGPDNFNSSGFTGDAYVYGSQQVNSGNYTVEVTGANGCSATETIYVQVNDNPEPYLSVINEVSCTGFSDGSFQVGVNGGTPFFSFNEFGQGQNFTGAYFGIPAGTYYVEVTDINQCVSEMPLEVIVTSVPNIAPVMSCPSDIVVNSSPGMCGAIVNYPTPVGSDVCPIIGTSQIAGLPSGWTFPVGTTVNTFRVTDAEGLSTDCSFSVTVTETEAPAIVNCPQSFSSCNPISWTPPVITDNCPGVQITASHVPGNFPAGVTTVTYTATDVYNNVSTCSFDVTRLEESAAATGITSNREFNNICSGESITLTIDGGSLGDNAMWKWYTGTCGGTALPAFNGMSSITISPTATTTYFARAEGACNTTSCVSITVEVSTIAPNSTLAITSMPQFGATGVTGTISCTPVPGATFYRWTSINGHINAIWFPSSPGPVETTVPSVNVLFNQSLQNYQIRVIAGNACGRTNNATAHIRGTVPATTCLVGPAQACPNSTATYSVSSCQIPGTNGYQWTVDPNMTIVSGQGTHTITVSFGAGFANGQVCVNGESQFGLGGPQTCLTVSNNTTAPGPITGNNQPCQAGFETYTIAAVPGATSYVWSTDIIGAIAGGTTTSGTVQFPAGSFSGNVCVQAVSGCGISTATCFSVASGAAGSPGPILGSTTGICGATVNYALSTNDANSYNWILPVGVTLLGSNGSNSVQVSFPSTPGQHIITVEAFYDCGSATSSITVDGAPGAPTVTPLTICAGSDETYIASATGADSYNWVTTGAVYESCTNGNCSNFYVIWDVSGASFTVEAINACGTSPSFTLNQNCRIAEGGEMETKVYPNPTSGQLTVEFTSERGGAYNLTVTDMSGRNIFNQNVTATSGMNQERIDLENANPGMYMLYIRDPQGKIQVTKVTKE